MSYIGFEVGLENDCEDQGFTKISDGCYNWKCGKWQKDVNGKDVNVRPQFIIEERNNHKWWICPVCKGNYGPAE